MKDNSTSFFDRSPIFLIDHQTLNILDVNTVAVRDYGISHEDFLDMNIADLGRKYQKRDFFKDHDSMAAISGKIWEHKLHDGTKRHVEFTTQMFNHKGRPARLVVAHDVTDILKNESSSVATFPGIPSYLFNSPFAEVEWTKDLDVKNWSSKAEDLFKWTEEEVTEDPDFLNKFIPEKELRKAYQNLDQAAHSKQNNYTVEGKNYTKSGNVITCAWYNSLLYDDAGELISIYSLVHDISERKQSEHLFRALSEESLVGVYLIQDDLFKYINPRFANIFGYSKEEIVNKLGPIDLTHPEDKRTVADNINKRIIGSYKSMEYDFRCLTKDGRLIHVNVYGTKITYKGKPAVVGTLVDITDNRLAFERYRASVESFEDLFDSISDAIYIQNRDGVFVEVNDGAVKMYGYERPYFIGKTPEILAAPGKVNIEETRQLANRALKGEPQHFEWWGKRKNGEVFPKEIVFNPGTYFGEDVVIAIARDISERYEAEEQMRKSEELFRQLFQNAPMGIVMLNEHKEVRLVNNAFEDIFGYESAEIKGLDIDKIIVPEQGLNNARELSVNIYDGVSMDMTARRKRKDGTLVDVLIYGVPVNINGKTIAIFGIYVDISERRASEEKIRHSLKEKEVLLAEIHHRVKNNLAVITGLLELQRYSTNSEDAKEVLYESQMRINSIALIHEKLYQSEDLSQISFDRYIKELSDIIIRSISLKKNVQLRIESDPVHLTVNQAIPCGLILNELVTNAFKHAFRDREDGSILISLKEKEDGMELIVRDDGVGLSEGFNINKTNSLGLTLIRTLTRQLKGESIFQNNETGPGTIFKMFFEKK